MCARAIGVSSSGKPTELSIRPPSELVDAQTQVRGRHNAVCSARVVILAYKGSREIGLFLFGLCSMVGVAGWMR